MTTTPRRTRRSTQLALALGSAAATLVGLEALLHSRGGSAEQQSFSFEGAVGGLPTERGQFTSHAERFYTLAAPYSCSPAHAGLYALGAWPFRGTPAEPVPPSLPRIAVIGDSCVFGVGVSCADLLPSRIQAELEAQLGLAPSQVLVAGFGVPGYSTVQIRALLEGEVLRRFDPCAIVLYLAAWNDHSPALGANDIALRAQRERERERSFDALERTATMKFLRELARGRQVQEPRIDRAAIEESWARNEPLLGRRVPEENLAAEVEAILDRARSGGRPVAVVLPAQRSAIRERHPGLERDRRCVERAARARGLLIVDSVELFSRGELPFDRYLCDAVHPAPEGHALLARALVEALAPELLARAWPSHGPPMRLHLLSGARGSALGDFELAVRVEGWPDDAPREELPVLCVGSAPLLDVRRMDAATFAGRVTRNAAGHHDLLLLSRYAVARAPRAVHLEAPILAHERSADGRHVLQLHARAGDRARAFIAAQRRALPSGELPGSEGWLDPAQRVELPWIWIAGPDGHLRIEVEPELAARLTAPVWIQAVVTPRGAESHPVSHLWTEPLEIRP